MSSFETASKIETICDWKIDNYALISKEATLLSPAFQMNPEDQVDYSIWFLKLSNDSSNIVIDLVRKEDRGPVVIKLFYEIYVIAIDGSSRLVTLSPRGSSFYEWSSGNSTEYCGHGIDVNDFLVKGALTLSCRMLADVVIYPMYWLIRTHTFVQKKFFKWTIEGFSSLKTKEYTVNFFHNNNPMRLRVLLSKRTSDDEIQIEINRMEQPEKQFVICQVCLLNFEGNVVESKKALFTFNGKETWIFPTFIHKKSLQENICVHNDKLSLRFEITNLWRKDISQSVAEVYFGGLPDSTSVITVSYTSIMEADVSNACGNGKVDVASDDVMSVKASDSDNINLPSFDYNFH